MAARGHLVCLGLVVPVVSLVLLACLAAMGLVVMVWLEVEEGAMVRGWVAVLVCWGVLRVLEMVVVVAVVEVGGGVVVWVAVWVVGRVAAWVVVWEVGEVVGEVAE